jgi:cobalt-zinc-cadmium efflux system outer membrane protein
MVGHRAMVSIRNFGVKLRRAALTLVGALAITLPAFAGDAPSGLGLDRALAIFRARSFDLRAAEAMVAGAEGDTVAAGQIENPVFTASYTRVFNYRADGKAPVLGPCITCAEGGPNFGINDSAALIHTLTGERDARVRVAKAALRASRLQREDARRTLDFQLKSQYMQVLAAQEALVFAQEIDAFSKRVTDIGRARHPGTIDDGQLARLEADGLRADLTVTSAEVSLDGEMAGLAYLLDTHDAKTAYTLDSNEFRFRVPARLQNPNLDALVAGAFARRPDLRASQALLDQASSNVSVAKYQQIPDVQLYMLYVEQGTAQNTATPPMLTAGLQIPLPLFYQQQGEIRRAEANLGNQRATYDRTSAQVIEDVRLALKTFAGARHIAEVMESALLEKSRRGRDIAEIQFREGSIAMVDLLDAQRQYTAVTQEYVQDLLNYWNAVFALEQAVGEDLRN